ncbi:hypothetical protein LCGC14_3029180, partial [marine sediment metagenome]
MSQFTDTARTVTASLRALFPATPLLRNDHLSDKFGASDYEAVRLMRAVHEAGLTAGVAFHVGSQCIDPESYIRALGIAERVIEE